MPLPRLIIIGALMKTRNPARTFAGGLVISLMASVLLTGCGKTAAEKASESDANGYVCVNQHKFYTDRDLFAEKCPKCATIELSEVYGYVCELKPASPQKSPGCGHVTLAPRGGPKSGGIQCQNCKKSVSAVKMPSGKELADWGALKATKEQVLLK